MLININKELSKNNEKLIYSLAKTALKYAKTGNKKVLIGLSFVNEAGIRELNKKYRKIDKITDVLSFPAMNLTAFGKLKAKEHKTDIDPSNKHLNLGDIIICESVMEAQAAEFGHSTEREQSYLFVHGLLHLLGFDHEKPEDKLIMRGLEEEILKKYNIKRGANEN